MRSNTCIVCLLCFACGGRSVDLGSNPNGDGWQPKSSTPDSHDASAANVKQPITLYDGGEAVLGVAVDETTLATLLFRNGTQHVDVCDLKDCAGTHHTIYSRANDGSSESGILLSQGEVMWTEPFVSDRALRVRILACSTNGCPDGPRQVAESSTATALRADSEYVYWIGWNGVNGSPDTLMRCPKSGCATPTQWEREPTEQDSPRDLAVSPSSNSLYASFETRIVRLPLDLSSDASMFYESNSPLDGLAASGEHLYFSVSTLLGEVRHCTAEKCGNESDLAAQAPNWPRSPVADEKQIYWIHANPSNVQSGVPCSDGTLIIAGATLGAELAGTDLYTGKGCLSCGLTMNQSALFWCDSVTDTTAARIRMLPR